MSTKDKTNIFLKKINYFLSFFILFFLSTSSNVSATSLNGLTLETGHTNTNQKTIYEGWATDAGGYVPYVPECGWSYSNIVDMSGIASNDWNYLYSKNSKICIKQKQNGEYRYYLRGQTQGQCASCVVPISYDEPEQCYQVYIDNLYLVAGAATKKYIGFVPPQWVINTYEFCALGIPIRDNRITNSGETSYTLKPICKDDKAIKSIQVNATVWLSSANPPSATDLLINGTTPTYIDKEYASYNEYEQLYSWKGYLSWEAPVNKKCEEVNNITITPSIANGYAYAIVGSINAIYGKECEVEVNVFPSEVWPKISQGQQPTGYNEDLTKTIVTVLLKEPAPSDGCTVDLSVEPVPYSGGHSHHDTNRPRGKIIGDSTISFAEDEMGAKSTQYQSSEVSGEEKIKVKVNGEDKEDETIYIKVPGLAGLGSGNYNLKCIIEPQNCTNYNHTSFYNVQGWVNGLFNQIAAKYKEKFPKAELLVVTDASLAFGGLYDYKDTWATPHSTHRLGTDVDVRSKNILKKNRGKFEEIVCGNYGFPYLESEDQSNEHYHLFFYPYKTTGKLCKGGFSI